MQTVFICAAAAGLFLIGGVNAESKGTARVTQSDGSTQTYSNVTMRIVNQTLTITSNDGKGTLILSKAACSYVGELQHCLPYTLTLIQGGKTRGIGFSEGNAYYNGSSANQPLPGTSTTLPPRGLLLKITTKAGTHISVSGKVDEVTK